MLLAETVIIGLAAWRFTALVSYERGPGNVFLRFRKLLGFEHGDNGEPTAWPSTTLANFVACPWCLGLWMAAGCWALWEYVSEPLVVVVAASSILIAVERWNHG